MARICYFPPISDKEDLDDVVSRLAWFLAYCHSTKISIPVSSERLLSAWWEVPAGMDTVISGRFGKVREMIELVYVESACEIESLIRQSDILLKWNTRTLPFNITQQSLKALEAGKKVWSVDPKNTRMEGSFYIEVGLHLLDNKEALIRENMLKFGRLAKKLGRFSRSYLMATGPSVWRYKLFNYEGAISIVCNSVILDDDLMAKVKPKFLVFADPIFHFGPSQYAAAFRKRLREAAQRYDFTIVIPFKYYGLLTSTIPELRDRTIAVPFAKDRHFNFDLCSDFEVKTTANILTLLLIPLAATFSDEINILGCDGRPLDEDKYFWRHNQNTQINDKMANIREVHPAFFEIDYNDYYLEHCGTLEGQLSHGERLGKFFISLGFSHIPALKSRIGLGQRAFCSVSKLTQTVIIIDPDAKSWSGHYMAYNEKLSTQLKLDGQVVEVICRKDLSADILDDRPNYFPTLTSHSWEVGNRAKNRTFIDAFETEISTAVEACLARHSGRILLYMYCGSLEHAVVLASLAQRFARLSVNINLFWLSFRLTTEYSQKWKLFIEDIDGGIHGGRFTATLPTTELRDHLAELTGCILPVAPHPSTGVSDQTFAYLLQKQPERECSRVLNVLFPSAPRPEKGYETSIESVRLLSNEPRAFHPIIRHAPTFSTPKEFAQPLSEINGAEIVKGELTDDEFLEIFARSDIVVLPYTPDSFAERTSGLLIDSMYFSIPSVVIRGTWLGNLTEKFGCGVVVDELSATNLVQGVREIASNFDEYRQRANQAGRMYFLKNSWSAFSKFLCAQAASEGKGMDAEAILVALVGPYSRDLSAHWDETAGVAKLFLDAISGTTMIDVGAHHGSALIPFLNSGWRVFAFEPDERNRGRLLERLEKHINKDFVSVDTRCVSNKQQQGVSFFASEQSTGISGLSAFHETHQESQKVDVTTLTDFFENKPLPAVDFLKIDTEGHDLFVLQGFPWEREKPAVIECEFEDAKTVPLGYTFHDLARFLVDKGYTVYVSEWHPIIRYGIRHDWRQLMRYPCELADPNGWGNLLAFRDPIDEQALIAAVMKVLKVSGRDTSQKSAAHPKPAAPTQSASAIPVSGANLRFSFAPGSHFTSIAPNQWRFTDAEATQKLWVAAIGSPGPTRGRSFVGTLRLMADRTMTVNVSLGRQGKSEYEGTSKRITLASGVPQTMKLNRQFKQTHHALKLQVDVLDLPGGGSAVLNIDGLGICESLASVRERLGAENFNLPLANRLYRDGEYSSALGIYLWLSQQHLLGMYGDNAVRAARRLGMPWVNTPDELTWITTVDQ